MLDENPIPTPAEKEEAARTRRRWLTLAELLGVAAVLISALTLWNSYKQRTSEEAEKAAEKQEASRAAAVLVLRGTADRDGRALSVAPADTAQTIQNQRILFPSALGVAAVETVSEPRIEARWFARQLLRARGENAPARGDARVPVAIISDYFVGGEPHRDAAIYHLGYRIDEGGLLDGDDIQLRGISRVRTVSPGQAQAQLDALWRGSQ